MTTYEDAGNWKFYVKVADCPSVMEMLDVMRYVLSIGSYTTVLTIKKVSERNTNVCYTYKHFET